jgi:hypothetical protein
MGGRTGRRRSTATASNCSRGGDGSGEARGGNGYTNTTTTGRDDNRTTGTTQQPQQCDNHDTEDEDGHHHHHHHHHHSTPNRRREQVLAGWKRGAVRPGTTGRGSGHDEETATRRQWRRRTQDDGTTPSPHFPWGWEYIFFRFN